MLPPFRLGLGGRTGSGRQWYSWIHVDDLVGIYLAAMDAGDGAYDATAPEPVTNAEFTTALGKALHRPAIFPTPPFAYAGRGRGRIHGPHEGSASAETHSKS